MNELGRAEEREEGEEGRRRGGREERKERVHHLNRFHIANVTGAGQSEESHCECGVVNILE